MDHDWLRVSAWNKLVTYFIVLFLETKILLVVYSSNHAKQKNVLFLLFQSLKIHITKAYLYSFINATRFKECKQSILSIKIKGKTKCILSNKAKRLGGDKLMSAPFTRYPSCVLFFCRWPIIKVQKPSIIATATDAKSNYQSQYYHIYTFISSQD